ncbi:MAG: acyl-CoA thioester hydrolase/BAAT C-terminal domain-containing protein [Hyphomonadaceae bacterium]
MTPMKRRLKAILLATTLMAAACATPAAAPVAQQPETVADARAGASPAGDWHGLFEVPPGAKLRIGIHVEQSSPGVFTGTVSSPDQGAPSTAMDSASFTDGVFTFKLKTQTWTGKWDLAQKAWAGNYSSPMGTLPMVFHPGPLPALPPNPAVAGLDGRWEGKALDMIPLVLRVATDTNGTVALMDSPLQNAANMAVPVFKRDGDTVSFEMPAIMAKFTGKLSPEGDRITGTFSQGQDSELTLKFVSKDIAPAVAKQRPQTPKKPYPYTEIETGYDNPQNPGVHIPCTLTVPQGPGPHPAALLLSGSGAQDRDETLLGHKPFLVLADHLTRKGIAVLRCDDRDYVKPPASGESSLIPQFVTDAEAAITMLRARPEIDPKRVGVIGHSEGGVTGPRLAAQDPGIAFVVTLAGVGVKGAEALTEQRVLISEFDRRARRQARTGPQGVDRYLQRGAGGARQGRRQGRRPCRAEGPASARRQARADRTIA